MTRCLGYYLQAPITLTAVFGGGYRDSVIEIISFLGQNSYICLKYSTFKTESIRKLSNFNFQWTKTLYQNNLDNIAFFLTVFKGYRLLVICNNTKDYFSWEPEKINVKFQQNCENTSKIPKISYVRSHFVKFDIYFLGLS